MMRARTTCSVIAGVGCARRIDRAPHPCRGGGSCLTDDDSGVEARGWGVRRGRGRCTKVEVSGTLRVLRALLCHGRVRKRDTKQKRWPRAFQSHVRAAREGNPKKTHLFSFHLIKNCFLKLQIGVWLSWVSFELAWRPVLLFLRMFGEICNSQKNVYPLFIHYLFIHSLIAQLQRYIKVFT